MLLLKKKNWKKKLRRKSTSGKLGDFVTVFRYRIAFIKQQDDHQCGDGCLVCRPYVKTHIN